MKTLQDNFTTTEQGRRLLNLGMAANSADCLYISLEGFPTYRRFTRDVFILLKNPFDYPNLYFPCWSVGRLIEIYNICTIEPGFGIKVPLKPSGNYIEDMVVQLEWWSRSGLLDLEKLGK